MLYKLFLNHLVNVRDLALVYARRCIILLIERVDVNVIHHLRDIVYLSFVCIFCTFFEGLFEFWAKNLLKLLFFCCFFLLFPSKLSLAGRKFSWFGRAGSEISAPLMVCLIIFFNLIVLAPTKVLSYWCKINIKRFVSWPRKQENQDGSVSVNAIQQFSRRGSPVVKTYLPTTLLKGIHSYSP